MRRRFLSILMWPFREEYGYAEPERPDTVWWELEGCPLRWVQHRIVHLRPSYTFPYRVRR